MPTPLAPRNAMPDAPEPKDGKEDGLQEAFRRFRERRIAERKSAKQAKAQAMAEVPPKGTPEFKQFLRRKVGAPWGRTGEAGGRGAVTLGC